MKCFDVLIPWFPTSCQYLVALYILIFFMYLFLIKSNHPPRNMSKCIQKILATLLPCHIPVAFFFELKTKFSWKFSISKLCLHFWMMWASCMCVLKEWCCAKVFQWHLLAESHYYLVAFPGLSMLCFEVLYGLFSQSFPCICCKAMSIFTASLDEGNT